ncbi:MAG: C-terminal binding protein [Nitratireductor sp.]|nr:C-terminal binding protein [Nitratireductor sp.]
MKIIRTDRELECPLIDRALREAGHELMLLPDGVGEEQLAEKARDADLILMCYTPVTVRVIEGAKQLRAIVKYGVGIDAIDIDAAKTHRVPVVNVPEYAEETVAEGAFALLIALAKRLKPIGKAMEREGWIWPESQWLASDLAGKTLGIVGCGRIGRSMARMAGAGFRMRVLGYDPSKPAESLAAAGIEKRDDLKSMLAECDAVSLHAVLKPDSRHLIGRAELASLKPGAILVNSARGALIDEGALVEAVLEDRLGGVGLDVFSGEPLALEGHVMSPLFGRDDVILHPHMTFFTHEAMARLEAETLERCFECLEGGDVFVKSPDSRLRAQTKRVRFPT